MKNLLLALLTLTAAFEASAQRRTGRVGQRYNPPGGVSTSRPAPHLGGHHGGSVVVARPTPGYGGPVVIHRPPMGRPVGPRYNPPGPRRPVVYHNAPSYRVHPRYVYNQYRHLRNVVRAPLAWTLPFGYTCNQYEQLMINGQYLHNFNWQGECFQAIQDIRVYGDFCDGADLYDQTGVLEAQFSFDYECRNALGYYY
jgi:hypothetical protein